eukprot:scaffold80848_cov30-Tisochrysis_lutea.AAC.12
MSAKAGVSQMRAPPPSSEGGSGGSEALLGKLRSWRSSVSSDRSATAVTTFEGDDGIEGEQR